MKCCRCWLSTWSLKTRTFWRSYAIFSLAVISLAVSVGYLTTARAIDHEISDAENELVFLAASCENLLEWGHGAQIQEMLDYLVQTNALISYAYIKHDGVGVLHTFESELPADLLTLHRTSTPVPSTLPYRNQDGDRFADIAVQMRDDLGTLHLGLSYSCVLAALRLQFAVISALGVVTLAMGVPLMLAMAACTVREVTKSQEELRASNSELQTLNTRLTDAAAELKQLMNRITDGQSLDLRFTNWSLAKCWETTGCTKVTCPCHKNSDNLRCWEVAGTFCRGEVQGQFAAKLQDCRKCEVYQAARSDCILDLGETFNEMIAILRDRHQALRDATLLAEASNRAKSDFLANMSHEIRTPMTAILGFADRLEDEDVSAADRFEATATIRRNGEHLLAIINDILDISKIEAGQMEISNCKCSLDEVVSDVSFSLRQQADVKGLTLQSHCEADVPTSIWTDKTRLRQILLNLVGNAIKFTESGEVSIQVVQGASEQGTLHFDVIDTGIGMMPETAQAVFQPFVQADNSTIRQYGGTGLGLALSRSFAQMLGGDVHIVESKEGEGTHMRLVLPVSETGKTEHSPSPKPNRRKSVGQTVSESQEIPALECRVLVAEDGLDNQRLIRVFLEKSGATISIVDNGRKAVDAALAAERDGNPFDVVLMDIHMPVLDGYGAVTELREAGYVRPIIAITAHAMAEHRDRCFEVGYDDYMSKPIDRHGLITMVASYSQNAVSQSLPAVDST